jgi:hypothetical protein
MGKKNRFLPFCIGSGLFLLGKNTKQNKHTEYIHYKNNTIGLTASIHTDSLIYCCTLYIFALQMPLYNI